MKIEDAPKEIDSNEKPTRAAIAAHEAGHAVAAWALSCLVERMWIEGDGGGVNIDATELSLTDRVAVYRPGAWGTDILEVSAPSWMAQEDREKVFEILMGLPHREVEDHIRRGGLRACQFLEANQVLLKAIAERLEKAGALEGVDFWGLAARWRATTFPPL